MNRACYNFISFFILLLFIVTVSQVNNPLRLNVGFLINQPIGTSRDFHIESPCLQIQKDLDLTDFNGLAHISRTPQGLLVQGDFRAVMPSACVRCLADFMQPLHAAFNELFAFRASNVTDSGLRLPENGHIDLMPLVREYFLLEVPIRSLCKSECKGLCVICGTDLNLGTCEHHDN